MTPDFLEFIRLLNLHHVDYILVGGYAYMFNVEPRFTGDIDFWVEPTRENLECLNAATKEFLGSSFDLERVLALLDSEHLGFKLAGVYPNLLEIMLKVPGVDFTKAKSRARIFQDRGVVFPVIHPFDQIRNKRTSNRDKDQLDLKYLLKLYGEPPEDL